ncbi:hypothetical protein ACFFLM_21210 [Deinococcus oregonensis]|uniref:Uncharacterized protein n=1 Tax=Deinococcus oregonensis TaxID=1805970 RepID=A0ABV6B400_9DEIO
MKSAKIFLLGCLLASTAGAAPLLGTKGSVAESNFCKTYECLLIDKLSVRPAWTAYTYYLKTGAKLYILRSFDENRIQIASLYDSSAGSTMTDNFQKSFIGGVIPLPLFRGCSDAGIDEHVKVSNGGILNSPTSYKMFCTRDSLGVGIVIQDPGIAY